MIEKLYTFYTPTTSILHLESCANYVYQTNGDIKELHFKFKDKNIPILINTETGVSFSTCICNDFLEKTFNCKISKKLVNVSKTLENLSHTNEDNFYIIEQVKNIKQTVDTYKKSFDYITSASVRIIDNNHLIKILFQQSCQVSFYSNYSINLINMISKNLTFEDEFG